MALIVALGACGPLPHPFRHESDVPSLAVPTALVPLVVPPVESAPGLSEAVVHALEEEDLAATADPGEHQFQRLLGTVDRRKGRINWILSDADGEPRDTFDMGLAPRPADDPGWAKSGKFIAAHIARILRRDGQAPPANSRQRLTVGSITGTAGFDVRGLHLALEEALRLQGYTVVPSGGTYLIEGHVQLTPADGGRDLVKLTWQVRDAAGKDVGVVSQANPVAHLIIETDIGSILRPIAQGAVDGVRSLLR